MRTRDLDLRRELSPWRPESADGMLRRRRGVTILKKRLAAWFRRHAPGEWESLGIEPGGFFGPSLEHAVRVFQARVSIAVDGVVGPQTLGALRLQLPALPRRVHFPEDQYPPTPAKWGLQPWLPPQVEAVCRRFSLTVVAGHGGSPPHAPRSDHRWGGAVDLAGPLAKLVACTVWADRYRAEPYREGAIFRWVGGPAADASGPEAGHHDHVHLSWYRFGPATTVFATAELNEGRAAAA